jgi:DNA (cytosine-5)-methyltransferase 1
MNYVGLFEGISGFGLAFKRAGANILAVCEIDKICQSVLRRHHPETEIISDVKTITKKSFGNNTIDILAGGFPCQDLSVAGLRKGLDGERSGLWFEFLRIITDHKPRIVVIENVPGLLSSNSGRDFAVILRGLVECGYGVCWRVFDSQFDGVAQRRNRVFIVASLGSADAVEILFERESSAWNSPPSREAREEIASAVTTGTGKSSGPRNGNGHPLNLIIGGSEHLIAGTVSSKWAKGTGGLSSDTALRPNLAIAYNLTFCDANGRRADRPNGGLYVNETEQANTLTNAQQSGTVLANQFRVRRLTPTECERLQGFPDSHTAFGDDGKPISDSARYRMLGNAVCVPTAQWIAKRIFKILISSSKESS